MAREVILEDEQQVAKQFAIALHACEQFREVNEGHRGAVFRFIHSGDLRSSLYLGVLSCRRTLALCRLDAGHYATRQRQEARANPQMRLIGVDEIDLKLQGVALNRKGHRAPRGKEIRGFADSQNAGAVEALAKFCVTLGFRLTDENDIAKMQIFVLANPADFPRTAVNGYASGEFG